MSVRPSAAVACGARTPPEALLTRAGPGLGPDGSSTCRAAAPFTRSQPLLLCPEQATARRPHNREHDLRAVPEAPPRGVPRRLLVRLPASAVGAVRVRAAAQLGPTGLMPPGRPARGPPRTTWSGNSGSNPHVATVMPTDVTLRTVHMPDIDWTFKVVACNAVEMTVTDPLLVVRRHVDLLRVRSAICRDAR